MIKFVISLGDKFVNGVDCYVFCSIINDIEFYFGVFVCIGICCSNC